MSSGGISGISFATLTRVCLTKNIYAVNGFLGIWYSRVWSLTLLNFASSYENRSLSRFAASLYFWRWVFVSFCHSFAIIFTTSVTLRPLYFLEITVRCSLPKRTYADYGFLRGTSFEISRTLPSLLMSVKLMGTFLSAAMTGLKLYSSWSWSSQSWWS